MDEVKARAIKILSVDDEPDMQELLSQKFRRQIRNGVYEFFFANNGIEALEQLRIHPDIDFILCDMNMPGMDGLTLLSKIQGLHNPLIKTVMVTAYGDIENIRTAMNNGAFDFLNKPINFEDLEITMNKTIEQVNQIRQSLKEREILESISKDLEIAQNIQLSLIPRQFPPFPNRTEIEIFATIRAAKVVGGDFYDFYFVDKNKLAFLIGDVAGKGIAGAIFMALSRTIVRTIAIKNLGPAMAMIESNNLISAESIDSMFVTVFFGILDVQSGELVYCNAGHTIPYIVKPDGQVNKIKPTNDLVLGIMEGIPYKQNTVTLDKGDTVFVYSDGVTEAMNAEDAFFGNGRLEAVLTKTAGAEISQINKEMVVGIDTFVNGADQSDDITTLSVRFLG